MIISPVKVWMDWSIYHQKYLMTLTDEWRTFIYDFVETDGLYRAFHDKIGQNTSALFWLDISEYEGEIIDNKSKSIVEMVWWGVMDKWGMRFHDTKEHIQYFWNCGSVNTLFSNKLSKQHSSLYILDIQYIENE